MSINCSTCLELFTASSVVISTQCGHIFHSHCIIEWLKSRSNCPLCRAECNDSQLRRIFPNFIEDDGKLNNPIETWPQFVDCQEELEKVRLPRFKLEKFVRLPYFKTLAV